MMIEGRSITEFLKKPEVVEGDTITVISNNQLGTKKYKVIMNEDGEKDVKIIADWSNGIYEEEEPEEEHEEESNKRSYESDGDEEEEPSSKRSRPYGGKKRRSMRKTRKVRKSRKGKKGGKSRRHRRSIKH